MKTVNIKEQLIKELKSKNQDIFTKKDLLSIAQSFEPNIKASSLQWMMYELVKGNRLNHLSHNRYSVIRRPLVKKVFRFENNDFENKVINLISRLNDKIEFQVLDSQKLNAVTRHQSNSTVLFVDVEKGYEEYIYEFLMEKTKERVFLKPDLKLFSDNLNQRMIVIKNLISESPKPLIDHQYRFEKLLVDSVSDKYLELLLGFNDVKTMYDEINNNYSINYNMINRYAKRRNALNKINDIIQ